MTVRVRSSPAISKPVSMIFRLPHAFLYTDPMTSRSGYGMVFVEITIFSLFPKQKGGFSRNMFILPAVIAMVFGLIYILYRSGCAVMNRKYALLYTEYPRMGKKAQLYRSKVFILQWSHQKSDSTPAVQKIPVCLFVQHNKRIGLC